MSAPQGCRIRVPKRGCAAWDEGEEGAFPPCPLERLPVPMEDKTAFPHFQRACRDGLDQRNAWTLDQLECLWAELDMLLAEVDNRRARLHGERAGLTVWMAVSAIKNPHGDLFPADEEAASGARTRSAAVHGHHAAHVNIPEASAFARQLSGALSSGKLTRDRSGRFLKGVAHDPESPRAGGSQDGPTGAVSGGPSSAAAAGGGSGGGGGAGATTATTRKAAEVAAVAEEGEAAGYEIRRVSADADPVALWSFADQYFEQLPVDARDVLDSETRARRFGGADDLELKDPFAMHPRGRHYALQWEEEARLVALADGVPYSGPSVPVPPRAAGAPAEAQLHWQREPEENPFTTRVINALVDQPGFIPDIAPTRAGAVDSLAQPTPMRAMSVQDELVAMQQAAQMERDMRSELVRVGLLDSVDATLADEDDALCAELRLAQAQLKAAVAQNEALCEQSRDQLSGWLEDQRRAAEAHKRIDDADAEWRVVRKRLKAERKAERKRRKLGAAKREGSGASTRGRAGEVAAAEDGGGGGLAAGEESGEGGTMSRPAGGTAASDAVGTTAADVSAAAAAPEADDDDSSEEEREEEPGPGWGAAAPDAMNAELAHERVSPARKRVTRQQQP